MVYAVSGMADEARQLLRELHKVAAHTYVSPETFAQVYLALGARAEALKMLERGAEAKAPHINVCVTHSGTRCARSRDSRR